MIPSVGLLSRQSVCLHTSAPFGRSWHRHHCSTRIHALTQHQTKASEAATPDRRAILLGLGSLAAAQALPSHAAKDTAQVGDYLPPSDIPGFVEFVPDRKKVLYLFQPRASISTVHPPPPPVRSVPRPVPRPCLDLTCSVLHSADTSDTSRNRCVLLFEAALQAQMHSERHLHILHDVCFHMAQWIQQILTGSRCPRPGERCRWRTYSPATTANPGEHRAAGTRVLPVMSGVDLADKLTSNH